MNVALWISASVLAALFFGAGALKLVRSRQQLATSGMGFAEQFSPVSVKLIGIAEILGAVGLILPALTHLKPGLVPAAAIGLASLMIGAAVVHFGRKEPANIVVNAVLFLLAVFVAWGRSGSYPLT
ncbi:DoxX family protein [Mycobacteroides abscessus]|uniref:DoxX family protein n=1 Tax=Mycobacteroides abscessus TaxID=36809 RepID=UPI000C2678E8|nr:DoxX family protein [Mycobacteroides abscessus]AWG67052.1 DoxX family protein [Mycobacteroides abscessus]RIS84216.1 DoxX family protein [Mycobacteroides abscessus]